MATEYTENINQILKDTLPELPGIVRAVAEREFRLAAREFFEKSFAWTTIIEDIAVVASDTAYQLDDSDDNSEVIGILWVKYGNDTEGYRALEPLVEEPDRIEGSESPAGWYMTSNPDEFKLHPFVNASTSDVLRAKVALIPAFDTSVTDNDLPRQITLKFYDALRDGFLARVYNHPNKPYSQPQLAVTHRQRFLTAIGYYSAQRKKGFNNTPAWSFPKLGWRARRVGGRRVG